MSTIDYFGTCLNLRQQVSADVFGPIKKPLKIVTGQQKVIDKNRLQIWNKKK